MLFYPSVYIIEDFINPNFWLIAYKAYIFNLLKSEVYRNSLQY
jgi:hypothetical protein